MENDDAFIPLGHLLIGPHPETNEENCWFYWPTKPPTPLPREWNEKIERVAWDVFNDTPLTQDTKPQA